MQHKHSNHFFGVIACNALLIAQGHSRWAVAPGATWDDLGMWPQTSWLNSGIGFSESVFPKRQWQVAGLMLSVQGKRRPQQLAEQLEGSMKIATVKTEALNRDGHWNQATSPGVWPTGAPRGKVSILSRKRQLALSHSLTNAHQEHRNSVPGSTAQL